MTVDTNKKRTTEKGVVIFHLRTTWFMCESCKFNLHILRVQYMYNIKYKDNHQVSTT